MNKIHDALGMVAYKLKMIGCPTPIKDSKGFLKWLFTVDRYNSFTKGLYDAVEENRNGLANSMFIAYVKCRNELIKEKTI